MNSILRRPRCLFIYTNKVIVAKAVYNTVATALRTGKLFVL